MGRQLCTQKQLLTGIHMGPTGLTSWLLFDSEGRGPLLAKAKKCKVSEVLWDGYKCLNGVLETSVMHQGSLKNYYNITLILFLTLIPTLNPKPFNLTLTSFRTLRLYLS